MKSKIRVSRPRFLALVLLATAVLFSLGTKTTAEPKEGKLAGLQPTRVSTRLQRLLATAQNKRKSLAPVATARPAIQIDDSGRLQAYIQIAEPAVSFNNFQKLRGLNVIIEQTPAGWPVIQARIPVDKIEQVAAFDFVRFIRLPDYAVKFTGSVTSEGDEILKAAEVRLIHNADGSGVRVGVISDGVDHAADARSTGDLPTSLEIDPNLPGSGEEGTAMLEIIHDLAPGAQLAFSGPRTSLEMLAAIDYLADDAFGGQGCDVIVDDLGFLAEPFFQDGAIAQKVEEVVADGVTYFTAVGNQANSHYEKDYIAGSINFGGNTLTVHDFGKADGGAGDVGQRIRIGPNATLTVVLQWNDTFFGAGNDYDLFIFNETLTDTLAASERLQNGRSQSSPLEIATYENTTAENVRVNVVIRNFNNAAPRLLEMHYTATSFSLEEFNVREGSIVPGQQSARGAISVGAISVLDDGNDNIESFSSLGPARIFFPNVEQRNKPDLTAVDGNLITGAGGFGSSSGNRFFGTSAAAPHAAAVAALLLSGNPSLSPGEISQALESTAVDLGDPGQDNTYGFGRIDALAAFTAIVTAVPAPDEALPERFLLGPNYPNPFNPTTTIRYTLPPAMDQARVRLSVYNHLGQLVKILLDQNHAAGEYKIEWDGTDTHGKATASGVYVYRLAAGAFVEVRKMLLLR